MITLTPPNATATTTTTTTTTTELETNPSSSVVKARSSMSSTTTATTTASAIMDDTSTTTKEGEDAANNAVVMMPSGVRFDEYQAGGESMLEEEENYPEPGSLQEELNEILDAFYDCVPPDDIRAYQRYVEDIRGARIAEAAVLEPNPCPSMFCLEDQDGDLVSLKRLLEQGPVVLTFYRGKWCPHCNATLMRYQRDLVPALKQFNANLVAISPMLADGTAFLATKRDLEFSVCSDFNLTIAKAFRLTFEVQPHTRPFMSNWGEHLPEHNGVDTWEIPLPATYVIGQDGRIAWSFIDNDPGIRAEVQDIVREVAAISTTTTMMNDVSSVTNFLEDAQSTCSSIGSSSSFRRTSNGNNGNGSKKKGRRKTFNRAFGATFKAPSLKKLWKSMKHVGTSTTESDAQFHNDDSSQFSIQSDVKVKPPKRTPRNKPMRTQSAQEFLGKYLLTAS